MPAVTKHNRAREARKNNWCFSAYKIWANRFGQAFFLTFFSTFVNYRTRYSTITLNAFQ